LFQLLPRAKHRTDVKSLKEGYIAEIDALECALVANALGAGRTTTDSVIDPSVGLEIQAHVGHYVKKDDVIMIIHHNDVWSADYVSKLQKAVSYSDKPLDEQSLVVYIIE